jgi:hypothetical protein
LLRAMYLLVVVGLGVVVWPGVVAPSRPWELMEGVVACMLAAFSLLCLLGLRYPLQLLPVLFWELLWKTIWLLRVVLPHWRAGDMDAGTAAVASQCVLVAIIPFVIPWGYAFEHYVRRGGERWL